MGEGGLEALEPQRSETTPISPSNHELNIHTYIDTDTTPPRCL